MQYMEYDDFRASVTAMYKKGGPFRNAADKIFAIRQKAFDGLDHKDVFSVATTHYGESRIPHCVKYDLPGRARLVTVVNNGICMLLYAGDHDTVDEWLEKNRNIDFISKKQGDAQVIEPVFISGGADPKKIISTQPHLASPDQLLDLMPSRYRERLLDGLSEEVVAIIDTLGPMSTDEEILQVVGYIKSAAQQGAVLDVILKLRESDAGGAKNRVDLYLGEAKQLAELTKEEAAEIQSGERVIKVSDVDPVLFEHFVKTASYQKWMLYLHPAQRDLVDRDHSGTVRLSGVSGSGKTCVLIHRALRLAEKYPDEEILVLTLNASLSKLIESLINTARGELRPKNIKVSSFWELCREKLLALEPKNNKIYTNQTIATNPYAVSEHIDEIWDQYYDCQANNHDAELMFPLHQSLLARGIFPKDYLKQEFDFVRSAFAPWERKRYWEMERKGRAIPLDKSFRTQVLDGLAGWEKFMEIVGAVDATGITTALYRHLEKLTPDYRCILVDEVQDFGTLELAIIRKLVAEQENDLFLCGDAAQSVYTKNQDYEVANINIKGARSTRLQKNYRNSRQILSAAHDILMRNFEKRSKGIVELEILDPEFANFSSSTPNLLRSRSLKEELEYAIAYSSNIIAQNPQKKVCIALAGYHQRAVEEFGKWLQLPVLNGDINLEGAQVFISDLEQTKGFEFDSMLILNANSNVLPHPDLPVEESFRDLSKFYVAMTRAKTELIVSFHDQVTDFIGTDQASFAAGKWEDYLDSEKPLFDDEWAFPRAVVADHKAMLSPYMSAKDVLRSPVSIGLSLSTQDKLLKCITGKVSFLSDGGRKWQKSWVGIGDFLQDMKSPRNRSSLKLSEDQWGSIQSWFVLPSQAEKAIEQEQEKVAQTTDHSEKKAQKVDEIFWQCPICKASFTSEKSKRLHIRVHGSGAVAAAYGHPKSGRDIPATNMKAGSPRQISAKQQKRITVMLNQFQKRNPTTPVRNACRVCGVTPSMPGDDVCYACHSK